MLGQPDSFTLAVQLFQLQSKLFRGRLDIDSSNQIKWSLYFYLGRLVWSGGGAHPSERWHRLLNRYCPELSQQKEVSLDTAQFSGYTILLKIIQQDRRKRSQILALVENNLIEVLFDILQCEHQLKDKQENLELSFFYDNRDYPKTAFTLARVDKILTEATQQWQEWQNVHLTYYSPNLIPVIQQPERLKQNLENSLDEYLILTKFVDGNRTLRSLALELQQPLPNLTSFFVEYVNSGMMSFVEVQKVKESNSVNTSMGLNVQGREEAEHYSPSSGEETPLSLSVNQEEDDPEQNYGAHKPREVHNEAKKPSPTTPCPSRAELVPHKMKLLLNGNLSAYQSPEESIPLVVCIDDSPTVSTQMKQIITGEGCRFLAIQDPVTAIMQLLKMKPDLIFLDLVMPIVNGYELCAQIRRISTAKEIPVVILTGQDGLIDRVRTKMIGANEFIAKPINRERVISILFKYDLIK